MKKYTNEEDNSSENPVVEQNDTSMFSGPIFPLIIKMALPIAAGGIFQLLYNVTDMIWISRIDLHDPSYVGGTGLVFPIFFLAIALSTGLVAGISSLVARAIGEKNQKVLQKVAESGLLIAVLVSIALYALIFIFRVELIRLLGGEGDYFKHGLAYLEYLLPAMVFIFMTSVFSGILQGEGRMKYVMISMLIGIIANIILDPIFIFLLRLNIEGAALATSISNFLSLLYLLAIFIMKKNIIQVEWKPANIDQTVIKNILIVGFPQLLSQLVLALSFIVLNRVIIDINQLALTAYVLYGRVESVAYMPIIAISIAITTIIGQNGGRGNFERIRKTLNSSYILSCTSSFILATIVIITAPFIFTLFSKDPEVVKLAILIARIQVFSLLFGAVAENSRTVFMAIGHPIPAMVITVIRMAFFLSFILLNVYVLKWGIYGFVIGGIEGNGLGALVTYLWAGNTVNRLESGRLKVKKSNA